MPYKIEPEKCVACGACADVCPDSAIAYKDTVYTINPEKCATCGACKEECPNGAITFATK